MRYRKLGRTGIDVSEIAFGAGPVPGLFTRDGLRELQRETVERAVALGINWFDTAATYGEGRSEANLGSTFADLQVGPEIHVATKVRLAVDDLNDIRGAVRRSCEASLSRLRRSSVTLLQLHNSITPHRGDQPTSITPNDVVGDHGVLKAMDELQRAGMVRFFGLTGLGDPAAVREVLRTGLFHTVQTPFNLLNPSAGMEMETSFPETDYGNQFKECARQSMGVFAIRVFAGGALVGQLPSEHTKQTRFFPLDLYLRDSVRADQLRRDAGPDGNLAHLAIQFVLRHASVSSAILGFSEPDQVEQAVAVTRHPQEN